LYFPDSTLVGVLVGRLAGVPWVIRTRNNLGYNLTPWQRRLSALLARLSDATITNSQACRQALLASEGPRPASVLVLENGVDLARFARIPNISGRGSVRRVGVVANLRPVKQLHLFIDAAARLASDFPEVRFEIGGEGELRGELARQITECGLEGRCTLTGVVTDVPAFLARLDVAVLCSRSEGMSNALLEYMAAGRAIVATAVGGNVELIEQGVSGLLVPPGDAAVLADAIRRYLEDPGFAAAAAMAARQCAQELYSREAMVERFQAFYEGLLTRGSVAA
jgi:glycosyltransferase involved in cell wall biosynthesis